MRALFWAAIATAGVTLVVVEPSRESDREEEIAAAVQQITAGGAPALVKPSVWNDVRTFYQEHLGAAWVSYTSTARASDALQVLRTASDHGLNPADYNEPELSAVFMSLGRCEDDAERCICRLASFDVDLTSALLALGHDVAVGRTRPESIDRLWKARREQPDLVGTLQVAASGDLAHWLTAVRPQHAQYAALQRALEDIRAARDPAIVAAMQPPLEERLRLLSLNLERWRWMPDDLGPSYILINIPAYQLMMREHGDTVFGMRVIVGKPTLRTPIFSAEMTTVVFSPYWHIPDSIARGETAPAASKDAGFLSRRGIDILSKSGSMPVDPAQVDWNDPRQLRQLAFRQRPGAQNALGYVKFLLPNRFDVYLHDTPNDNLFERERRALSHGCIRLEDPLRLTKYVLRDNPRWDDHAILSAMHSGVQSSVKLGTSLPVHIAYFTAWVDDRGALSFFPDVYGYDRLQLQIPSRARTQE